MKFVQICYRINTTDFNNIFDELENIIEKLYIVILENKYNYCRCDWI